MFAVTAARIDADNPLAGLELGEHPEPSPPEGWTTVTVRATALNHHDVWTLRGVGISADRLPIVLGCDAAGTDEEGNEVVVHAVVGDPSKAGGDETLDPGRSLLSERHDGTFAERVAVPRRNLLPKPAELSFAEAACLPTAYLTAYRMLFVKAGVRPGDTVLIQGAGGGVASAAIVLGRQAGLRVWVTSRDAAKGEKAKELGAHEAFESGARLPERVDAVLETVGEATWKHSLRALKPGGTIVVVNHFMSENIVLNFMEKRLAPLARHIGFHPDFPIDLFRRESRLSIREVRPSNLFGYWKLLRCVNEKPAEAH